MTEEKGRHKAPGRQSKHTLCLVPHTAVRPVWRWIFPSVIGLFSSLLFVPAAPALIGGQIDSDERYRSVVSLIGGSSIRCSGTKIAKRSFLTAAHCVTDTSTGGTAKGFLTGQDILVSNLVQPRGRSDYARLKVESIRLDPRYQLALERFFKYKAERIRDYQKRYSGQDLEQRVRVLEANNHFTAGYPDIAIITVLEETAAIPAAKVDCHALSTEESVQLVGYGIEGFAGAHSAHPAGFIARRKWGETQVIRVDATNFYTYAHQMRAGSPSLAPGDSGGPVMREGRIVGINGTVYGLHRVEAARSNMSVNLNGLGSADNGTGESGCREFFKDI